MPTQPISGLGSLSVTRTQPPLECLELRYAVANHPSQLLTTTLFKKNMSTSSGLLTYYDGPIVWIDCEMTGLDYKTDRILEIAVSAIGF